VAGDHMAILKEEEKFAINFVTVEQRAKLLTIIGK
jgi:hypothetical protein